MANPPAYHSVVSGVTVGSAGDINQFVGTHPASYIRQGTAGAAYMIANTGFTNVNTGSAKQWLAQPFTTGIAQTTLQRVELNLSKSVGAGSDITMEIRTDNSGVPSNVVLFSIVIPADFMPGVISIPANIAGLSASTKYHVVLDGTTSTTNISGWFYAASSTPPGVGLSSTTGTDTWVALTNTFLFTTYFGTGGVLRHTIEDGLTTTNGPITGTNSSPARWTGLDYTVSGTQNFNPVTYREYVGNVRTVRTLTYSTVLTKIA